MEDPALHTAWLRHHRGIAVYKRHKSNKRHWPMEIITLIGTTGTGKTRWAYDHYPDLFSVDPKGTQTWFNGYDEHDVVLIDEIYGNRFSHSALLQFTDRYPIGVPIHGGTVNFCAHTLIFTSNKHPSLWYDQVKFPWADGPLQRRLTTNGSRIYTVWEGGETQLIEGEEPVVLGPINNPN